MVEPYSLPRRLFVAANYTLLIVLSLACVVPLIYVLALSLSSSTAAASGVVFLWPVDFTWSSYEFIVQKPEFLRSMGITLQRVMLGVSLNMIITVLVAYPLSKEVEKFPPRTLYAWIFVFTMLFSGGLIPLYMTIRSLGLLDTIWALVLHHGVPIFNVVLLLNFFRGLPKELEEAAYMDGAGHLRTLVQIFLPLSLPAIATITLFATVYQWNAWFDGILFMNSPDRYPLQTYLHMVVIAEEMTLDASSVDLELLQNISSRTTRAAQIFLGAVPILLVYPFLQRYFMKGIVLGSVKG